MNTKTARLLRRYITVTQPGAKPFVLRRAKKEWLQMPRAKRATKRCEMQAVVDRARARAGDGS